MLSKVQLLIFAFVAVALQHFILSNNRNKDDTSGKHWCQAAGVESGACGCTDGNIISLPSGRIVTVMNWNPVMDSIKKNITFGNIRQEIVVDIIAKIRSPGMNAQEETINGKDSACIQVCITI